MLNELLSAAERAEACSVIQSTFLTAIWETLYVTIIATFFAVLIGLPLGVILVIGEKDGIRPLPAWLLRLLNFIINVLRSLPFLILMILIFPFTRLIMGTVVGTRASIVPLVMAAFPFVARITESSLREVDAGSIEMARSMGSSTWQIITRVLIPESVPSLIANVTLTLTNLLGYSAMSGIIGGGGLGKIAINYGYYRYKYLVMFCAVILLILMVQAFQSAGTALARRCDKRLR